MTGVEITADNGCFLTPSCLKCPFAVCFYDDPHHADFNAIKRRTPARVDAIKEAIASGSRIKDIAAEFEVSVRTVHRYKTGR